MKLVGLLQEIAILCSGNFCLAEQVSNFLYKRRIIHVIHFQPSSPDDRCCSVPIISA